MHERTERIHLYGYTYTHRAYTVKYFYSQTERGVGDRALSAEFHQQQGDTDDDGGRGECTGNNARPGSVAVVARVTSAGGSAVSEDIKRWAADSWSTSRHTASRHYRRAASLCNCFIAGASGAGVSRGLQRSSG